MNFAFWWMKDLQLHVSRHECVARLLERSGERHNRREEVQVGMRLTKGSRRRGYFENQFTYSVLRSLLIKLGASIVILTIGVITILYLASEILRLGGGSFPLIGAFQSRRQDLKNSLASSYLQSTLA